MSDLFHEDVPDEYIAEVFEVMERADWHIFQVLTKRQDRLAELASELAVAAARLVGVSIENRRFVGRARPSARGPGRGAVHLGRAAARSRSTGSTSRASTG